MKKEQYLAWKQELTGPLQQLKRRSGVLGFLRLLSFCAMVFSIIAGTWSGRSWWYAAAGGCLILFFVFVVQHHHVDGRISYYCAKQAVLESYLSRFDDGWRDLPACGTEYVTAQKPQIRDLDLFGRHSLYQYLCCAGTPFGKQCLTQYLLAEEPDPETLRRRQSAVGALANMPEFTLHFQTLCRQLQPVKNVDEQKMNTAFIRVCESMKPCHGRGMRAVMVLLPVLTVLLGGLAACGVLAEYTLLLCLCCVFCQFVLLGASYTRHAAVLRPMQTFCRSIEAYQEVFQALSAASFQDPYLQELQQIFRVGGSAEQGLKHLRTIYECVKLKYYGIPYIILAGLGLWEHHCVRMFEKWRGRYGRDVRRWLESVGTFEALISLTIPCAVRETWCFPKITEDPAPLLQFQDLHHPLIPQEISVGNTMRVRAKTCVITGSNMSGKTTLLRSIGVNLVLAYAGAPVAAQAMTVSCMRLFTSMRVVDDVSSGISTFYAELLRIKEMVDYSKQKRPMIALIDEIFKGTNSRDRIAGAAEAAKKLAVPWVITMSTTHDFELCNLAEEPAVRALNFHFTETYTGDEIQFSYKMQDGRCTTTNARHLLRLAGII